MRSDKPESLDVQKRLLHFLRENEIILSHFPLMDYESVSHVSRVVHNVSQASWIGL
jgi:hypothetical protein